jgi:hypothetical protein
LDLQKATDKLKQKRIRYLLVIFCCGCVGLPLALVAFPPILDLAQQSAQIRLLGEFLSDVATPYRVQLLESNKISYVVLGISWLVAPAAYAGRLAMAIIAFLWVGAYHWLAAGRNRPVSATILGSIFLFNHFFYMGFLNFAMGFAVFILWFARMTDPPPDSDHAGKTIIEALVGSLLLYWAHALWLVAGAGWLWLNSIVRKHSLRSTILRTAGMVPFLTMTVALQLSLMRSEWGSEMIFIKPTLKHLTSSHYIDYALGGVRGFLEPAASAILLLWATLAVWQNRKKLRAAVDWPLFAAGILFIASGILLPATVGHTLAFGSRWVPVGCALFVLALPPIRTGSALARITAAIVLAAFCAVTARIWMDFERREMSGFGRAMAEIEPKSKLLGLDFVRGSSLIKMQVFYQMFAYSQVLHGGEINWSFAESATSLVVYKDTSTTKPWTKGLIGHPELVKPSDFEYFDYTLIHGTPEIQDRCAREGGLVPVTEPARWRLFKASERTD